MTIFMINVCLDYYNYPYIGLVVSGDCYTGDPLFIHAYLSLRLNAAMEYYFILIIKYVHRLGNRLTLTSG